MNEEKEYYGIKLNDDIPKIDKVNKFGKEVEVQFEGKAFLIERNDYDKIIERTELKSGDKLKKEKDYEIEFINQKNKLYYLQVRIECSYLFFILLLFLLGFLIGLILARPVKQNDFWLGGLYDFIDLSVIELNIDKADEAEEIEKTKIIERIIKKIKVIEDTKPQNQYDFDATFKNISSDDISLANTMDAKAVAKNKIAPRSKWKFLDNSKYK